MVEERAITGSRRGNSTRRLSTDRAISAADEERRFVRPDGPPRQRAAKTSHSSRRRGRQKAAQARRGILSSDWLRASCATRSSDGIRHLRNDPAVLAALCPRGTGWPAARRTPARRRRAGIALPDADGRRRGRRPHRLRRPVGLGGKGAVAVRRHRLAEARRRFRRRGRAEPAARRRRTLFHLSATSASACSGSPMCCGGSIATAACASSADPARAGSISSKSGSRSATASRIVSSPISARSTTARLRGRPAPSSTSTSTTSSSL